jgi:hypothetical protein
MPRKSPEALAAAAWLAGGKPPAPPNDLQKEERLLWKRIVNARPPDFFMEGNLQLLANYVRTLVQLRRAMDAVASLDPAVDREAYGQAVGTAAKLNAMVVSLATKLRLSIQSAIRTDSGKNNEGGSADPLLFGSNVTRLTRGKAGA